MAQTPAPSDDLVSLLYVSRATAQFRPDELPGLVARATERNLQLGLSGALLCYSGRFLQVLEGPSEQVERCFSRIGSDPRHGPVVRLCCEPLAERRFPKWAMRLVQPTQGADRAVTAFLDRLEAHASQDDCRAAVQLLERLTGR